MMTEWDDFAVKTCPSCHGRLVVPSWPASGEISCANGCYKGYAYPNLRRSPLVSGMVRVVDSE